MGLPDSRIEIDSNIVERAIRPQTITRKNALFAGSHGGDWTWATTLLRAAKMNDVEPTAPLWGSATNAFGKDSISPVTGTERGPIWESQIDST
jgi:hypothetical protein